MAELNHECGIAAIYHLPNAGKSRFPVSLRPESEGHLARNRTRKQGSRNGPIIESSEKYHASRLIPHMLLDMQNRGQLAAGMATYKEKRSQLIDVYKDVGSVTEVFHLNQTTKHNRLMEPYDAPAAIGHVRYATCGPDDKSYAQPFERHHIEKTKWFAFGFNGQLANYKDLEAQILKNSQFHLTREIDTEILRHLIAQELSGEIDHPDWMGLLKRLSERLDGAWNLVFLSATGDMMVSRDPLGFRPLCYAREVNQGKPGPLFAAASESIALAHLGFREDEIYSLNPGEVAIIQNGELRIESYANQKPAHCFFEWIYFSNVASTCDDRSVYLVRKRLGEALAKQEQELGIPLDEDTIVVPVPDTAKAAADSMAFQLKIPSMEGLIRNRFVGRTFIEGHSRAYKVKRKFMPLQEVLQNKKVILVEDSIVRSTTLRVLLKELREVGGVRELHVRVACPPIIAPCFYGIDMSTVSELFAPRILNGLELTMELQEKMGQDLGVDSLLYLPVEEISKCITGENSDQKSLCLACVTGKYPTSAGSELYQKALAEDRKSIQSILFDDRPIGKRIYD